MQHSKEWQGEVRKPSSVINANKQRKTIEQERLRQKTKTVEWEDKDLFKKIRDTKGTFHAKMGTIKDKNYMDITEADDIKQKYTEEL